MSNSNSHNIFILILNWNGKADTIECLKSLKHVESPHHTVVIDNDSTDDSVEAFKQFDPSLTILETGKNLGYAGGNNIGIEYALREGATHILILNNDTAVSPKLLEGFLKRDYPIQGASAYLYSDPNVFDHLGGMWNERKGRFDLVAHREKKSEKWNKPIELDYACGCALFIKVEVFEKVGLLDPRYFLFWEESDWCLRAKAMGYPTFSCPEAELLHKVSASFTGGKPHATYFWWRSRMLWIEKCCSTKQRFSLYFRIIFPELCHQLKLFLLKSLQLGALKLVGKKEKVEEKAQRLACYRATLLGARDYFLRRFNNGPTF